MLGSTLGSTYLGKFPHLSIGCKDALISITRSAPGLLELEQGLCQNMRVMVQGLSKNNGEVPNG